MRRRLDFLPMVACGLLLAGCGLLAAGCGNRVQDPEGDIDVDLIENPNSANGVDKGVALPEITFDAEMHDFGRLTEGETISYSFHFRNTGKGDLVISHCSSSCGCTVADYPKERMAPGEDGYIFVSFNSQGKAGQQYQEVDVVTNAMPAHRKLKIVAQVGH